MVPCLAHSSDNQKVPGSVPRWDIHFFFWGGEGEGEGGEQTRLVSLVSGNGCLGVWGSPDKRKAASAGAGIRTSDFCGGLEVYSHQYATSLLHADARDILFFKSYFLVVVIN